MSMRWFMAGMVMVLVRASAALFPGVGDDPGGRYLPKASSYTPPAAEDTVFVGTGSQLGRYLPRSASPLRISFAIRRYFGTAAERRQQQHRGLLPEYVHLLLPAYDVDTDGTWAGIPPECDNVYFNGRYIGTLDGKDNTWLLNLMRVRLDDLCFPEFPGGVGENHLEIEIDVLNSRDEWSVEIEWAALLIPSPRPVLFVHGLWSSAETWAAAEQVLSLSYGLPGAAINLGADLSIEANAIILQNKIRTLQNLYGVEEFNLVAHSKGGLDARCYSSSGGCGMDGRGIHTVMQIATPNAGSNLANVVLNGEGLSWYEWEIYESLNARLQLSCAALRSLTPEAMRLFNRNCPPVFSHAGLHVLAGWAEEVENSDYVKFGLSLPKLAYDYDGISRSAERNGDAIVSVASAQHGIDPVPASPMHDTQALHCEIISRICTWSLLAFDAWLTEIKEPGYMLTSGGSGSKGRSPAERPAPILPTRSAVALGGDLPAVSRGSEFGGILQPGENREFSFGLPGPAGASLVLLGLPPEVAVSLTMPDGRRLSSADHPSAFACYPAATPFPESFSRLWADSVALELVSPPRGQYTLRVDGAELALPCTFAGIVQEKEPALILRGGLATASLPAGESLVYRCRIEPGRDPLQPSGHALQLRLMARDGTESLAEFIPVGDGVAETGTEYQAEVRGLPAGEHQVRVDLTHTFPDGVQISRRLSDVAVVSQSTARLLGSCVFRRVDRNGNYSCEILEADVGVAVDRNGTYFFRGVWCDDEGRVLATWRSAPAALAAGERVCTLEIGVKDIFKYADRVSLHLGQMALYESGPTAGQLPVQVLASEQEFVSPAYVRTDFELPLVTLAEISGERALDRNGDGVCDVLQITLKLRVRPGGVGRHQISATLLDREGRKVAIAYGSVSLFNPEAGIKEVEVTLEFSGAEIGASRVPGPYGVDGLTVWASQNVMYLKPEAPLLTAPYSVREFLSGVPVTAVAGRVLCASGLWQADRQSGALQGQVTLDNPAGSGCVLELAFWLALAEGEPGRLVRQDGILDDGRAYVDLTAAVEEQLLLTGNRDRRLDPGERVSVPLALYVPDRRAPDAAGFSLQAVVTDLPFAGASAAAAAAALDENGDARLDDDEVLQAVILWRRKQLSDWSLLQVIEQWRKENEAEK